MTSMVAFDDYGCEVRRWLYRFYFLGNDEIVMSALDTLQLLLRKDKNLTLAMKNATIDVSNLLELQVQL